MRLNHGYSSTSQKGYEESGKIANESISFIRTVCSFSLENNVLKSYENSLIEPMKEGQ